MADSYLCDAQTVLTYIPCFSCLTPNQLAAIKVWAMCNIVKNARGVTVDCTPATLQSEAKCFSCISPSQLEMAHVAGLVWLANMLDYITPGITDINDLVDEVKCLACMDIPRLESIYQYLWCTWLENLYDTLSPPQ